MSSRRQCAMGLRRAGSAHDTQHAPEDQYGRIGSNNLGTLFRKSVQQTD